MLIEKKVRVEEVRSQDDIKKALEATLYVPDEKIKPKIIEEYLAYLASTSKDEQHDIKTLVAFKGGEPEVMTTCHVHPGYTSYGRK